MKRVAPILAALAGLISLVLLPVVAWTNSIGAPSGRAGAPPPQTPAPPAAVMHRSC